MSSALRTIFFLLFSFACHITVAQVRFSATVNPSPAGKDEYVQLRLLAENATEIQKMSSLNLNNLTIVSGPNQESGMSVTNGNVKRFIAISYILKPTRTGRISIPPATAIIDGNTYRTNPLVLQVLKTATGKHAPGVLGSDPFAEPVPEASYKDYILRKGERASDKIRKNMLLKVEVNKSSCYVGEPVIATYKLYTRLKSESNLTHNPSFNGFSVIDLQMPDNMNYTREKLNGREYNVYVVRKAQLYPLQAGKLELESAEIENSVVFMKEEYAKQQLNTLKDIFQDFADATIPGEGMETHRVNLQSQPVFVTVKPLPDANKPASFRGAVGNFTIDAALEKDNFSTDDAGKLNLVLNGSGNLQLVTAPTVQWPTGLEAFEPKTTDDLTKTSIPVSGRKIIEYPFTVAAPGNYTINPVSFSFFDPAAGVYKTIQTKAFSFSVSKGTGKSAAPVLVEKKKESPLNNFFSNRLRVVSVIAVLIILCLLFWLKRDRKKEALTVTEVDEEKKAVIDEPVEAIIHNQENPLAAASESLEGNEPAAFYNHLNHSFMEFLAYKLKIPMAILNKKTICDQLDKKGISNETCLEVEKLIDEIEFQLYTPFAETTKMKEVYERANEVVQLLNTYK